MRIFGTTFFIVLITTTCSGFQEALDSRVCYANGIPVQCDRAYVEFSCPMGVAELTTPGDTRKGVISALLVRDIPEPVVGELFSQYCPPSCIKIFIEGESPWQTLRGDVESILILDGYEVLGMQGGDENVLELDLTRVDVRSDDPGWLSMKITTHAEVFFTATLRSPGGDVAWSESFNGRDEIRHSYAGLDDSETILGNAYCQALASFARGIQSIDLASQ